MDLVVKELIVGAEGTRMYGICQVLERQGTEVTAWELLHWQNGEPWAFPSPSEAQKKKRAFERESADYLTRAGIAVGAELE